MKLSKKQIAAAVQKAATGFLIPINGEMPKLYAKLEAAVVEGKTEAELKAIVAASPGVTVA